MTTTGCFYMRFWSGTDILCSGQKGYRQQQTQDKYSLHDALTKCYGMYEYPHFDESEGEEYILIYFRIYQFLTGVASWKI